MPKIIDYPRASLKSAIELANAVDELGGSCSTAMAAERTGRKVSGAFHALTSSTAKYGLIESKSQKLSVTQLYREYKLSYTDDEKKQKLRTAVLSVSLFGAIYERFAGKELPLAHFDRLLIREFSVPDELGARVAAYFLEAAKEAGMLDDSNKLVAVNSSSLELENDSKLEKEAIQQVEDVSTGQNSIEIESLAKPKNYFIRIIGPGMDSNIEVNEIDDLEIVEVMLKKVKKALESNVG